jgi:hypothetical protein
MSYRIIVYHTLKTRGYPDRTESDLWHLDSRVKSSGVRQSKLGNKGTIYATFKKCEQHMHEQKLGYNPLSVNCDSPPDDLWH